MRGCEPCNVSLFVFVLVLFLIFLSLVHSIKLASREAPSFSAYVNRPILLSYIVSSEWLGSRVVSVLDTGAEGPGFTSQPRRCRVTVLGKLFTPIVSLFTKQRNW